MGVWVMKVVDLRQVGAALARGAAWMLGRRCQLCGAVLDGSDGVLLCAECAARLAPRTGGYCPRCGLCYADPLAPVYACLTCRTHPPLWGRMGFFAPFAGALRDLVHRHKFFRDHGVSRLLGELLCAAWEHHGLAVPDLIVPVPLRISRLLSRGFNQSVEIARPLARRTGARLVPEGLRKIRKTKPQSTLGRKERRDNVREAFLGSPLLRGRRVLLVDDVMTTGATLDACARACARVGVGEMEVLVLARAL